MAIQIRQITQFTGDVAVPGQAPAVFSQNAQDQLGFMNGLADELVNTISDMNESATEMEENAGKAENAANTAEALLSGNGYKGLWPDTGGTAEKGDTYQTQVGGTPTGNYFTALQNTSVDPVGDNVNWKVNIGASNVRNPNLLSNGQFKLPSPDDSLPAPSATPQDYPAGFQIFSGWFADDVNGASGVTSVNGILNWTQDGVSSIYTLVPKDGDLTEYTASLTGKVAGAITAPDTSHVSFSDNGDGNWRITIANSATDIYSCKFELGSVATGHYLEKRKSVPQFLTLNNAVNGIPNIGTYVNWPSLVGSVIETSYFSLESMKGSARYIVKTAAQVSSDGDVIDGDGNTFGVNHQIDTEHFLILLPGDNGLLATQCGASPLISDNSVQLQSWMDFEAITKKHLPYGQYLSNNLTIPNRFQEFTGDGKYLSTIRSIASPTNTDYLVASDSYVNNSTYGNYPIKWRDIRVWSDGPCDNAFVWYGYGADLESSYFWTQGAGDGLRLTSRGIDGTTTTTTTLVENRINENTIRGNGTNHSFTVRDMVNRMTDSIITKNIIRDGLVFIQTTAGSDISENHFYGSSDIDIRGLSVGTVIADNYFENPVEFSNYLLNKVMIGPGNQFGGRVTYTFGGIGELVFSKSNNFFGTADILHNFFGAGKVVYSLQDTFVTSTPYVFNNSGSTGRITARDCIDGATPEGAVKEGSRTGSAGAIVNVWWNSSDPTSGNWTRGDVIYNPFPVAGGKRGRLCTTGGAGGSTAVFKEFGQINE